MILLILRAGAYGPQTKKRNALNYAKLLFGLSLILQAVITQGQDIHFTQFYNAPLSVSPALTGIFSGDQRFSGIYRGQWHAANSPFSTFQGMFDTKVYNKKFGNGFVGLGGSLTYDRSGDSRLTLIELGFNGSYTYSFNTRNFLTGGLMVGFGQRSFQYNDLRWNNQYDGESFVSGLNTGENLDENGYVYPDMGLGINYRRQKPGTRSTLDIGAGYYHLHKPNQSFADRDESPLEPRLSLYLIQYAQLAERFDLFLNGLAQVQNEYFEGIGGFGGRWHLDQRRGKELAVQLGLSYRFNRIGDAATAETELQYQYWRLAFSYDLNVSGFRAATNRNGGPEVSLRYIIHFVKPIPVFRVCPII